MEGDQSRDRNEETSLEVKMVDGKDIERVVNDLLQGKYSCREVGVRSAILGYKTSPIDW